MEEYFLSLQYIGLTFQFQIVGKHYNINFMFVVIYKVIYPNE